MASLGRYDDVNVTVERMAPGNNSANIPVGCFFLQLETLAVVGQIKSEPADFVVQEIDMNGCVCGPADFGGDGKIRVIEKSTRSSCVSNRKNAEATSYSERDVMLWLGDCAEQIAAANSQGENGNSCFLSKLIYIIYIFSPY